MSERGTGYGYYVVDQPRKPSERPVPRPPRSLPSPAQRRDWYATNRETPEVKVMDAFALRGRLRKIGELTDMERDLMLCWLAGYTPEAVDRALTRVRSL